MLRFFFFNDTATTEIYTLSLHDALPISSWRRWGTWVRGCGGGRPRCRPAPVARRSRCCSCSRWWRSRSEEHTSELQSQSNLVCRLLLEKKKKTHYTRPVVILMYHTAHRRKGAGRRP